MSSRTDAEHNDFAQVPTKLLADLTSADGPIFTFVEGEGQLYVNPGALKARAARRRAVGAPPMPVVVPPIVFQPAAEVA